MFANVSTADKIETIVDCFRQRGLNNGAFGTVSSIDGVMYVTTDDRHFRVWTDANGNWNVREGDAVGTDASLIDAAAMLIGADLVRKQGRI
jgi:hypothetical protein